MPRPPPPRAITACCTCTPRSAHRPSPSTNSSHPLTSASTVPSSSTSTGGSQPFTTSSSQTAAVAAHVSARTPPVLDFLYPGFGFFSRSLPPRIDSPVRDPSSSSASTSTRVTSSPGSTNISGPPPPPPLPVSIQDPLNYRSREGQLPLSTTTSSKLYGSCPPTFSTTATKTNTTGTRWRSGTHRPSISIVRTTTTSMGQCICGRISQTFLRCRGKSTNANTLALPMACGHIEHQKGKTKEATTDIDGVIVHTESIPPAPISHTTVADPLASFRTFSHSLDSVLPSSRTSSSDPHGSPSLAQSSSRRRLSRKRSNLVSASPTLATSRSSRLAYSQPLSLIDQLAGYLDDERNVWNQLSYYDKLDAIRLFSRITKLSHVSISSVPHSPSSGSTTTITSVLDTSRLIRSGKNDLDPLERRLNESEQLFLKAGRMIEKYLHKLEIDRRAIEKDQAGVVYDQANENIALNELSEAGLWITSFSLRGGISAADIPDPSSRILRNGIARGTKLQESIMIVFGDWDQVESSSSSDLDVDAKRLRKKVQAIRTGLSTLFENWEQAKSKTGREGGEGGEAAHAAFKLVYGYDLNSIFDTVLPPTNASSKHTAGSQRRQQKAYNDQLKRQYGQLLSRLKPSPSEWLEEFNELTGPESGAGVTETVDLVTKGVVPKGLHLIQVLSRAGSAGEARKIWDKVEHVRNGLGLDRADMESYLEDRLRSLTSLVDGLVMEKFYEDANSLTRELGDLAKEVATSEDLHLQQAVLDAYRILAKLASNQGRAVILERILKKIDVLSTRFSVASPLSAIETFARRLRAKSARYEVKAVRALFTLFQSTPEWAQASKEEQARLWSQLILAQTRVNDVEQAVESLQNLIAYGLRPPVAAINAVLFGFARRGEVETVDDLFRQLFEGEFNRSKPDVGSWNALVLARTTMKDPSAAVRVIQEMRRIGGVEPNRQTWTTLMAGLVDTSQWEQALEVYHFLDQHPSVPMRPDTAATNVILKACILTATPASSVLTLFRQLLLRGFRPNMMTYTLVLQSLTTAGLMSTAEELYLLMDRSSTPPSGSSSVDSSPSSQSPLPVSMSPIRPDQFIFSTLIAGYLKRNENLKARACLAEMHRRGIQPSSITLAIVVGSRLDERTTPQKVRQMVAEVRTLLKENGGDLAGLRKAQPSRKDRKLAMGDEALVVFAPIFKSAAEKGLAGAALEILEEIQSRRKTDAVPVELYTMLMDAFRRVDDSEAAADNVKTVWDRLYESIAERFMTLNPSSSSATSDLPSQLTAHTLTTSRLNLRIDPAQASILCVPLTIFLESLARAQRQHLFGITWRTLARQGFAFDASNWNVLALYFARDLQLERAFWIAEHILLRSSLDTSPLPSAGQFEDDFANVSPSKAFARIPSRLSTLRQSERHLDEKDSIDIRALLSSASTSRPSPASANLETLNQFEDNLAKRQSLFWRPYGNLLEALASALETLTLAGNVAVGTRGGHGGEQDVSALEFKRKLMRDHPKTMKAIDLWQTRGERKEREQERYLSTRGRSL